MAYIRKKRDLGNSYYINGKYAFSYGSEATGLLFDLLYEQYGSVIGVLEHAIYDEDLKKICNMLLDRGAK